MKVLFLTPEAYPLIKTGGLADVASALPTALRTKGVDCRIVMPGYPEAMDKLENKRDGSDLGDLLGAGTARLVSGYMPGSGVPVWLVDCAPLYRRPGGPYLDLDGNNWPDNFLRFAMLSRAATCISMEQAVHSWIPDIVHANDWQSGLLPVYQLMFGGPHPGVVFTIHNIQFQGIFDPEILPMIGIHFDWFHVEGIEFHRKVSYLKAALCFAECITTVSPTYAEEIKGIHGWGLDGLLQARNSVLSGILNGADYTIWNPRNSPYLSVNFDAKAPAKGKKACKVSLQREMKLEEKADAPLIGVVSRLSEQKGLDLLLTIIEQVIKAGGQIALLGTGDKRQEAAFVAAASANPGRIAAHIGYDEALSHRIQAGSDMFLIPSRFEPCGLTQMYAMAFGTIPIARRTGGLADTISDASSSNGTGFLFDKPQANSLWHAIHRAFILYRQPRKWQHLRRRAMRCKFGWNHAAKAYMQLYKELITK